MPHPDQLHFDSIQECWLRLTIDILARNQEMLGDDDGPLARFLDGQSQFLRGQYDQGQRTGFISNHVSSAH